MASDSSKPIRSSRSGVRDARTRIAQADPNQGKVLAGTYKVQRLLGEGGMGRVYEVAHLRLTKKRYAVKILNPGAGDNADAYARFRREAEIASEIGHPHIVEVHDFNVSDEGQPFIAMELLSGEDLAHHLEKARRVPRQELVRIVAQVSSALTAAHQRGVIHRDLKPENIFLTRAPDGELHVKLLDFGLSTIKHNRSRLTQQGTIMGTPHYMAPEQASGQAPEVDQRTDIFALAIVVYECLCGEVPFDAPTPLGVLYKVCNEAARPLSQLVPGLHPEVDAVLARALAKRREDRYASVEEFAQQLIHILERPARATPPQPHAPTSETDALEETPALPVAPLRFDGRGSSAWTEGEAPAGAAPLSAAGQLVARPSAPELPRGAPPLPHGAVAEEPVVLSPELRPSSSAAGEIVSPVTGPQLRPPPEPASRAATLHEQITEEKLVPARARPGRWLRVAVVLLALAVTIAIVVALAYTGVR